MYKIVFAALVTTFVSAANAADMYVGVKLGETKSHIARVAYTPSTFGVSAGRMLDPNWAIEAEYLELGNMGISSASALSTSAVGFYPGNEPLSLFAKINLAHTRWVAPGQVQGKSFLSYGMGGQYDASSSVSVRLSWDVYKIGSPTSTIAEVLSVTGMVRF